MALREMGWGGIEWFDLAKNSDEWKAVLNMVMNFWFP
jgi:hypothetical protein